MSDHMHFRGPIKPYRANWDGTCNYREIVAATISGMLERSDIDGEIVRDTRASEDAR